MPHCVRRADIIRIQRPLPSMNGTPWSSSKQDAEKLYQIINLIMLSARVHYSI